MNKPAQIVFAALLLPLVFSAGAGAADDAAGGGDILFTKPVQSVLFSHKAHVEKKGLTCDLCHSGLFEMSASADQEKGDFNMAGLAQGKYCGACHNGVMAFSSATRCASCHGGVKQAAAFPGTK